LTFELTPRSAALLSPDYSKGLHAWFLDQIRRIDPSLSKELHDEQTEKAFTLSRLEGDFSEVGQRLELHPNQIYRWSFTVLSARVMHWLKNWLTDFPDTLDLRGAPLGFHSVALSLPPTTYDRLLTAPPSKTLNLSFLSPTSFRHRGHHFPLPVPRNLFHSYLRRWNTFSGHPFDQETFLDWIDEFVVITRLRLESHKVPGGKKGAVTGFTGAISLSLDSASPADFAHLYSTLGHFAPYCGTGHKTTFGLGQTQLGWPVSGEDEASSISRSVSLEEQLAQRIERLTEIFLQHQKRPGGTRALQVCQTRATILARREFGDSLEAIATDLEMPYETVKTYAKLARRLFFLKG
jgi:CRISPR-associated endoribonuclease Cas6